MALLTTGNLCARVRRRRGLGWVLVMGFLFFAWGRAAEPSPEYQVKAVFLFNFTQFVEWPNTPESAPVVIGVLGEDPFGAYLDDLVRGESVSGHPLVVRRYRRVEEVEQCHVLFIVKGDPGLGETLRPLRGRPVLTVSDGETFTRQGGLIQFVTEGRRIRLRINAEAARAAGLILSSKLLRSSTVVSDSKAP